MIKKQDKEALLLLFEKKYKKLFIFDRGCGMMCELSAFYGNTS